MAVNVPGLIMMLMFYLLVIGTGIWASVKSKKKGKNMQSGSIETSLLGNRSINLVMGVFTMTGHLWLLCCVLHLLFI